jgi:Protein of unknown function (DUF3126)
MELWRAFAELDARLEVLNPKHFRRAHLSRRVGKRAGSSRHLVLKPSHTNTDLETAVDVQEVRKLDAYLKRVFGNPKIRVVPRPKKEDSAEVYIGEEFIGVLFVDDEDDDRSFQFQMAILEDDLVEQG